MPRLIDDADRLEKLLAAADDDNCNYYVASFENRATKQELEIDIDELRELLACAKAVREIQQWTQKINRYETGEECRIAGAAPESCAFRDGRQASCARVLAIINRHLPPEVPDVPR